MPEHQNIPEDGDPARKKLKGLTKLKAPWYFEARLQQRIRAGKEKNNWFFAKPIPAFAWSLGVFLCLCAAGYYMLMPAPYLDQQIPGPGEGANSSHQNLVEDEETTLPTGQPGDRPADNAGPSATPPEMTTESGVEKENTGAKNRNHNQHTAAPKSMQSESNGEDQPGGISSPGQEALDSLARRSRDSVQAKRDSLKNQQ